MEMNCPTAAPGGNFKTTLPSSHEDVAVPSNYHHYGIKAFVFIKSKRSFFTLICIITLIAASYIVLVLAPSYFSFAPFPLSPQIRHEKRVEKVLERAAMPNSKTVIITSLNAAWAKEGTMIDIFLESFWHGHDTRPLLQHLVIVCVDDAAYQRCLVIHPHCLFITTPGVNFTGEQLLLSKDYIKLMWRRIKFLQTILQMNYSFVFTDADVLWFRNPFPRLEMDPQDDFQIACDVYNGNPHDRHNPPNTGFIYVRSNERTLRFYEYWYEARIRDALMADQGVLNAIKFESSFTRIGLTMRFLDTQFFGGFCALGSTDMTKAITVHATCCKGLEAKLIDLRAILEGWKKWQAQNHYLATARRQGQGSPLHNASVTLQFHAPWACPLSWHIKH